MEEQIQIVELSEKTMDQIAKKLHKLNLAEKKKIRDNAYHNTKMLLTNYHVLKAHCDVVNEQLIEEVGSIWSDDRFELSSLLEHKAKTAKLMIHVDRSLEKFKELDPAGYDILKMKYLNKLRVSDMEIAVEYGVDRSVISKRFDKHIKKLSIILFGMEVIVSEM
ncbi:hypothetical protein [Candidatus Enterococcus mansonii]|uniref:Uncharacterized protein n=1 Tax=Candidatus Enterococcus mansonii TaxID=1834181 RepID=A0A242CIK4_9ENTE|nr:hypothetical protein [Enterococcus sp. 4G2_DIV0659]OTO09612.1 hypothetical protein A5880_000291 [Enterococcus sp. 4G2_DIV0659]